MNSLHSRYFHIKRRSSESMEVFNYIKEKYFARNSESKLPQQLLDAAWETSPNNVSSEKSRDIKTYDIAFTLYLQKVGNIQYFFTTPTVY